jgi:serine/threonine protein kinase
MDAAFAQRAHEPVAKLRLDPQSLIGLQVLGRYTILQRIGMGGMSVVYRGQDERLRRPVCLKVFFGLERRQVEYQTAYEHFVQEAFALSQLQHPNTLRIYDFGYLGVEPYSPFQVSELMSGGTLEQLIKRVGRLAAPEVLEILAPVCETLAEAHGRGIIHRDIKPSNLLLGEAGVRRIVKLADFGIAKARATLSDCGIPNQAGETQGAQGQRISLYSPAWAAPEQLRAQEVGPSTDVFALGLVVAFMLSGRVPFAGGNVLETLGLRMDGDSFIVDRLARLSLPASVVSVLLRACRGAPSERYDTVDEFFAEIQRALLPSPAPNVTAIPAPALVTGSASAAQTARRAAVRPASASLGVGGEPITEPTNHGDPSAPTRPRGPPPRSAPPPPRPSPNRPTDPMTDRHPIEAQPAARARLVIENLAVPETMAGTRRFRLLPLDDTLDFGGPIATPGTAPAPGGRFRLTFVSGKSNSLRLHLRGLNCFLAKPGGRCSSAVDVSHDTTVELRSPTQRLLDTVRCVFGAPEADDLWLFRLPDFDVGVPRAQARHSVLLDFGPGREVAIVYAKRT